MRLFAAPIMAVIFLGWVFYIAFITKTYKQYKNEVFAGFFFIAIWVVFLAVIIY